MVLVVSVGSYVVSEVGTYKNGNDKNSDHNEAIALTVSAHVNSYQ